MASQHTDAFFSASPTVVLPPNPPDQYFSDSHYANAFTHNTQTPNSTFQIPNTPSATDSIPPTPGSLAGRKRSRGDVMSPEEEEIMPDGSLPTPLEEPIEPRGKPLLGPGMTLIYPDDTGYAMTAESQSGTWVEQGMARKPFQLIHTKCPSIASRKSQRMDSTATAPDDLAQLVLPPCLRQSTVEPFIDEATRVLGISWVRMDSSESLQISQKAYAKWINNHYPGLKDVTVWFANSAIPGYLVMVTNAYNGQQEYYIFSQDLTEARLVTIDPAQLVPRLQMLPALHLAAPGGYIHAEDTSVTAKTAVVNGVVADINLPFASAAPQMNGNLGDRNLDHVCSKSAQPEHTSNGICGAHAMELD